MKFAFMLKTYYGDIQYVNMLIKSFHKYNADNIHLFIVCPKEDMPHFRKFSCNTISIIHEEFICDDLLHKDDFLELDPEGNSHSKISSGYANQQIIKLSFYRLNLCDNYLCIDSDSCFIKPFYISDFMYNEKIPYTILSEDNDLQSDPAYYNTYWINREEKIKKIYTYIGYKNKIFCTSHNNSIFNSSVLKSFYDDFMKPKKLTYRDIISISCYEFSWYNIYLQHTKLIKIIKKEPIFKMFHTHKEYLLHILGGVTKDALRKSYIGYTINSNWAKQLSDKPFEYGYYNQKILTLDILSQQPKSTYFLLLKIFISTTKHKVINKIKTLLHIKS